MAQAPGIDKSKALEGALSQIERAFGKGSIMRMGERPSEQVDVISTGSLGLDIALGIRGLPRGRIVEIYGPESSGKTTMALHAIAEAQRKGGTCAFIDAEHALDPGYARKLGVDVDNLLISQPDAGEQALEIADTLVRSGAIDVLVLCGGSKDDLPRQSPELAAHFNLVDSFDTHARIPEHFPAVEASAQAGKTTALLEAVLIQPAGVPTAGGTVHGLRGLLQELP